MTLEEFEIYEKKIQEAIKKIDKRQIFDCANLMKIAECEYPERKIELYVGVQVICNKKA